MVFCPTCGQNVGENLFCVNCGENIQQKLLERKKQSSTCPRCFVIVNDNDVFCPECGTRVKQFNRSPVVAPSPQFRPNYAPYRQNYRIHSDPNRLYRSRRDKWLAGVCGGIAMRYNISSGFIRLLFIFLFFLYGIGFLIYVVLVVAMPIEPINY